MVDHTQATKAAIIAGFQALVQRVPGVNELIESINSYKDSLEKQKLVETIDQIIIKLGQLDGNFDSTFYNTENGKQLALHIFKTAQEVASDKKLQFLANLFISSADHRSSFDKKSEFVSLVERLPIIALDVVHVLWNDERAFEQSTESYPLIKSIYQYKNHDINAHLADKMQILIKELQFAVQSLHSNGILKFIDGMDTYVAFTEIGKEFADFVSDPVRMGVHE